MWLLYKNNIYLYIVDTESSSEKKIQDWFLRRKQLQEDPAEKKKLLLFCYMRGGSTFFGEFFKANLVNIWCYLMRKLLYYSIVIIHKTFIRNIGYVDEKKTTHAEDRIVSHFLLLLPISPVITQYIQHSHHITFPPIVLLMSLILVVKPMNSVCYI